VVIENKHFNVISIAANIATFMKVMRLTECTAITAIDSKTLSDYGSIKGSWKQENCSIVQYFEG